MRIVEEIVGKESAEDEKEDEKEAKAEDTRPRRSNRTKRGGKENAIPSQKGMDFLKMVEASFGRKA